MVRPAPGLTEDNQFFWTAAAEGRLVAQRCRGCQRLHHPPRPACPECHCLDHDVVDLAGTGTVYSYAVLHHPQNPRFHLSGGRGARRPRRGRQGWCRTSSGVEPADVADRNARAGDLRADGRRSGRPGVRAQGRTDEPNGSRGRRPSSARSDRVLQARRTQRDAPGHPRRSWPPWPMPGSPPHTSTASSATRSTPSRRPSWCAPVGMRRDRLVESGPLRRRRLAGRRCFHAAPRWPRGAADVVVAYRALRARSGERFGRATTSGRAASSHSGTTAMQWCYPFGVITPASWMALNADSLHAHVRGDERGFREGGRPAPRVRRHQPQRPLLRVFRSCWRITSPPAGSPSPASGCSTAARRPTARWRS